MKIDIITIFPNLFNNFLSESLLARAQKKRLLKIKAHDLRKWTKDKHRTVDDRPYGGGAGMLMKIEPIFGAVESLKLKVKSSKSKSIIRNSKFKNRVILLSAKGKTFTQKDAHRLAKYDQLVFICGRYEGVDERVAKYVADEEISIGNYVLFGGEVPAMVITEAVARLVPSVIAKEESIKFESFSDKESKTIEYPQYTRPEVFKPTTNNQQPTTRKLGRKSLVVSRKLKVAKAWKVPKVLLSGDHKKIEEWRRRNTE